MKRAIIILFLAVICKLGFASVDKPLPVEPWRAIVFMEKHLPFPLWKGDVTIQLLGNYTQMDSILLENSIKFFNSLCETVHLRMASYYESGMLEICLLDSTNKKEYERAPRNGEILWVYRFDIDKALTHVKLKMQQEDMQDDKRYNFLTNCLAIGLYPKILRYEYSFKKGKAVFERPVSIFNQRIINPPYSPDYYAEFNMFDSLLIRTVYASDFKEIFPIAMEQFDGVPQWLRKNAYKAIAFPLALVLFVFTGLLILFYKKVGIRIKNKLLQFNVFSILGLLLVSIFGAMYVGVSGLLSSPYYYFINVVDAIGVILVILILGLPALNLFRLIEYFVDRSISQKYFKVLILFLSTSLIPSVTLYSIYYFGIHKGDTIQRHMDVIASFFFVFVIIGLFRALVSFFIMKEKELKIETEIKLANLRELKTKAELNALHSKINPHFLYNSLNSIAGLAKSDAHKTEQMALSLSKLFRYSINKEQSDWSTIGEEIEMVQIYLDIEKVRFDDRLTFCIDLPDELKQVKIPRFIIQPLVENAIKHGVANKVTDAVISIFVQKNDRWVEIAVHDNGPDFPADLNPGFGLQSIYDKLDILYSNRFELHFINSPEKQVLIKLS
ncbi:MAG: histidine kinase [Marinilabiliaceae bacterium]|nr:histidine kinase [Marinilabiliaceae bacterium]